MSKHSNLHSINRGSHSGSQEWLHEWSLVLWPRTRCSQGGSWASFPFLFQESWNGSLSCSVQAESISYAAPASRHGYSFCSGPRLVSYPSASSRWNLPIPFGQGRQVESLQPANCPEPASAASSHIDCSTGSRVCTIRDLRTVSLECRLSIWPTDA